MSFILQHWDNLIGSTLYPENLHLFSHNEESMQIFIEQSEAEQDNVRMVLIRGMLESVEIRDKQQYVKINQVMLIQLLNKLNTYKQQEGLNNKCLYLYDVITKHLEKTLLFLEDFFNSYFDRNEKVPACYHSSSIKDLRKQLEIFKQVIQPYKNSIPPLADILINNFNRFCLEKKNGATYNELKYQKDLMDQLITNTTSASEISIKEILFNLNYNDEHFIAYLFQKLKAIVESLPTETEKIAALRFEQKNINQIATKLNCYVSSSMPSLKEQINHWIKEEIQFLEVQIKHLVTSPLSRQIEKEEVYLHVPFKGAEIYLLHKSFIDSGGASGETYKSLFEKTGCHLTNKTQKGFSTESLQKNSDKVNYESKENVKRFLQKMIRNIDSY